MKALVQRWRALSLTLRSAMLFALVAALVVSGAGWYLYDAMRQEMTFRSDLQVTGRVEYYRNLLSRRFPLEQLMANTGLFENMLGNEQDVLIFQQSGQKSLINVNPARVSLPPMIPTPVGTPQRLSAVQSGQTAQGVPLRAASALVRLEDGNLLQISAAHVMFNEQKMLARYLWRIVAAVIVAFVLIALLGYWVMRRGLQPLWRMAAQAAVITPNTLSTRLSEQGAPKELQQLTRSFNAMLDRLNEGYQRLTQFSADLAHEIRTPVGALMGQCQVALYQSRSVEEYETLLSNNMDELERISRMVENILFLARAGEGQAVLNVSRLDMAQELQRVADYFEGLAEERGITLVCAGRGQLLADAMLFQRALSNLVANAVRYADENSQILLQTLTQQTGEVVVQVVNQGPAIAPAHLDKLFDRFYRADAARSSGSHASGLGLAIVRAIMTLHGGVTRAHCSGGNNSARITFSLIFPAAD
ncbi:Probable sensor-like histidine kinase YedV [Serratia quinivorans]|uniref:heavy metal sensor histidine kinase n=1 Tax=Serratia TaxID=613 RepID=UPI00216A6E33|nr:MULTISPECIES: heavy metal sensor histidine kinase [Serratia]MCS4264534.1 two-component system heavy metal sensor histidine kinase CusS [Serratia sp. BIGb0163]CAI0867408.1 Probable sensor-like histidine kinase YedV [Serratia quinivorans]CAI0959532.1 Probable sensor-like histidine kinase YedV [Serratia quinivorans]